MSTEAGLQLRDPAARQPVEHANGNETERRDDRVSGGIIMLMIFALKNGSESQVTGNIQLAAAAGDFS